MLDARAVQIKADLDEARALREEAKAILASYERKQKEVQEQSERIVASAKEEAMAAAEQAKADLKALDRPPSGRGRRPDRLGRGVGDASGARTGVSTWRLLRRAMCWPSR